jgi:site-specific DNA-methyltransferase (adenine-specific)
MDKVLHSSKSNEHYTPDLIKERVLTFFDGTIDLDPCTNSCKTPNIPALFHYDATMDGLSLPWAGRVFVNPPYGRGLPLWIKKAIREYEESRAREILILVPSRTDTQWYKALQPYARLFIEGRLKFKDEAGTIQPPAPFPSAVFYLGNRIKEFELAWEDLGEVRLPVILKKFDKKAYQREYMRRRRSKLS